MENLKSKNTSSTSEVKTENLKKIPKKDSINYYGVNSKNGDKPDTE